MPGTRLRLPVTALARREAPARRRPPTLASTVLALQRSAGNKATTRVLARDAKGAAPPTKAAPPTPAFRLIVVDDGDTGLEPKTVEIALTIVADELKRVTSKSTDDTVKSGFSIEHTKDKPEKWKPRDLGVRSFLVFLSQTKDAKHAVGLAAEHVDMTPDERKAQEEHFKANVATEGGVNIQNVDRRRRSVSTSIVSTTMAIKMQAHQGRRPRVSGRPDRRDDPPRARPRPRPHQADRRPRPRREGRHDALARARLDPALHGDPLQRGEREDDPRAARGAGQAQGPIAVAGPGYDGVAP